jgi:CRISPR-associated exonuclease Cas4
MSTAVMLNVSDLKQYLYCPRVVWYRYCQPVHRSVTGKMAEGTVVGEEAVDRERRRSLRAYGLGSGERTFEVWLSSERIGLCGRLDMLITTGDERIPVEFKNAAKVALNHRYQLVAYSLLLEEVPGPPVRRGYVYLIAKKQAREVIVTPGIRSYVTRAVGDMRRMVGEERYPAPTAVRARHRDCEYRPYCMDLD